jgi:hypothetical protein
MARKVERAAARVPEKVAGKALARGAQGRHSRGDNERSDIIKKLVSGSGGRPWRGKWKSRVTKNNMERDEDTMSSEIHGSIAL